MVGKPRTVTDESLLAAAVRITEEKGLLNLNVQQLAADLNIKPASLYNHIKSIDEVKVNVARYAVTELDKFICDAVIGYAGGDALLKLACGIRDFAVRHPELYNAFNLYSILSVEEYRKTLSTHSSIIHRILNMYELNDSIKTNFLHAFRSGIHGFISLEAVGAFGGNKDTDESFRKMTVHLIKMLEVTDNG